MIRDTGKFLIGVVGWTIPVFWPAMRRRVMWQRFLRSVRRDDPDPVGRAIESGITDPCQLLSELPKAPVAGWYYLPQSVQLPTMLAADSTLRPASIMADLLTGLHAQGLYAYPLRPRNQPPTEDNACVVLARDIWDDSAAGLEIGLWVEGRTLIWSAKPFWVANFGVQRDMQNAIELLNRRSMSNSDMISNAITPMLIEILEGA